MDRRRFIQTTLAASALAGSAAEDALGHTADPPPQEFYELRRYQLRTGPKQRLFHSYYRDAKIPALGRMGIGPVGVFEVIIGPESPSAYVLIVHKTIESFAGAPARLASDKEYLKSGEPFLQVPASDPAYVRAECSLFSAFAAMPTLEVPKSQPRIFELRTYESHSKAANRKKIEMFNNGEIALFRRSGLQPVFFGEALSGANLPNLTYMLTFPSLSDRDQGWSKFGRDPDWKKLSSTPGYTDVEIVCNISNALLRPSSYSQI